MAADLSPTSKAPDAHSITTLEEALYSSLKVPSLTRILKLAARGDLEADSMVTVESLSPFQLSPESKMSRTTPAVTGFMSTLVVPALAMDTGLE